MRHDLEQQASTGAEQSDQDRAGRLLKGGLGGAVFAALCCFTPLLVVVLAGAGLSVITGWLDYALFPMLFVSLAVVAQALWLRAGRPGPSPKVWATLIAVLISALIIATGFLGALTLVFLAAALTAIYAFFLNRKSR